MTDLSYQTKKVYISKLSAFEEAYHAGEVSVNLDAEPEPDVSDAVPQHSQSHKVSLRKFDERGMRMYVVRWHVSMQDGGGQDPEGCRGQRCVWHEHLT